MHCLIVSAATQELKFYRDHQLHFQCRISTAARGLGEEEGSQCTPRGWHQITEKIGDGAPINAVFQGRKWTGEIYTEALAQQFPKRDWILTRILWLRGLEPGFNQGGSVDTQRRYIYFHATPAQNPLGIPLSHGCIRLHSEEMIQLFDLATVGTRVFIG